MSVLKNFKQKVARLVEWIPVSAKARYSYSERSWSDPGQSRPPQSSSDPSPTCGPASQGGHQYREEHCPLGGTVPCQGHIASRRQAGPGLAVGLSSSAPDAGSGRQCPGRPALRLVRVLPAIETAPVDMCDRCLFSRGHLPRGLMFNSLNPGAAGGRWVVRPQASAGPIAFSASPSLEWALALGR